MHSPLAPAVQDALADARRALATLYGDRLVHAVLYGSQARGEARAESDVDVLVVLRDPVADYREIKRLVPLAMDLQDRHGVDLHLIPFSADRYADPAHPLMMNVHGEGIDLADVAP
ncbi:nucleotidyltransferase domain-containing protein [Rubrivirga sp. IMCC45206]|uniref:nucleotidyltransferase domain-containing protein n=1 Tax=Rubrivirga sp. IMCC45206 TaxID=3391614 RepID=UPI00398FE9C9